MPNCIAMHHSKACRGNITIIHLDIQSYAKHGTDIVLEIVWGLLGLPQYGGTQTYVNRLVHSCSHAVHMQFTLPFLYHLFITGWWVYAALCRGGWLYCCLNAHSGGAGPFSRYCRCDASPPYVSTAFSMVNFVPCRLYFQNPLVATLVKTAY